MTLSGYRSFMPSLIDNPPRTNNVSNAAVIQPFNQPAYNIEQENMLTSTRPVSPNTPQVSLRSKRRDGKKSNDRERQALGELVTQLQKDVTNKDAQISRLAKELNHVKSQLSEKDAGTNASNSKNQITQQNNKTNHSSSSTTMLLSGFPSFASTLTDNPPPRTNNVSNAAALIQPSNQPPYNLQQENTLITSTRPVSPNSIQVSLRSSRRDSKKSNDRERQALGELVTQLQKDVTNKDAQISRLTKELNHVKSQLSEKDSITDASSLKKYEVAERRYHSLQDELDKLKTDVIKCIQIVKSRAELQKELDQFIQVYTAEAQQKMKGTEGFRSSSRLKQQIESLNAYVPTSEILKRFQNILLNDLQDQVNIQQRLEGSTQEAVGTMQSRDIDADKIQRAVEEVTREERIRQEQLLSDKEAIIEQLENQLRETRQISVEKQPGQYNEFDDMEEAHQLLSRLQHEIEFKETQIEKLKTQLDQQTLANITLREETEKQCESRWKSNVNSNREQIQQQARTICIIQQRLIRMKKQLYDTRNEVLTLRYTNPTASESRTHLTQAHNHPPTTRTKIPAHVNGDGTKQPSAPSSNDGVTSPKLGDQLKSKIGQLKNIIKSQISTIGVLRSGLEDKLVQLNDSTKNDFTRFLHRKDEFDIGSNNYDKRINLELFNTKTQLANLKTAYKRLYKRLNLKEDEVNKLKTVIDEITHGKYERDFKGETIEEISGFGDKKELENPMDALRISEDCYLNLIMSLTNCLDIDQIPEQRSLVKIPKVEKEKIMKERQYIIDLFLQKIEILKDQIQNKESLLNEYERDLGLLKQAEMLTYTKGEQLYKYIDELNLEESEVRLLQQNLDRVHEALLKEQGAAAALKKSNKLHKSERKNQLDFRENHHRKESVSIHQHSRSPSFVRSMRTIMPPKK
ncbi:unnamed protein product [Schistosoma turkestanicum]|nr:unnamed protein product [Schistosoma turkestanicum]